MKVVIFGSEGNVGRRLRTHFPRTIGIDRVAGAEIVADLESLDFDAPEIAHALASADAVIHLATSANVEDPDAVHYQAVIDAARLLAACQRYPVPRVLLPSSDWASPKRGWMSINTYGHSKRVFETMAEMYRFSTGRVCTALRIGWVARGRAEVEAAPEWLRANWWPDERLFAEVDTALGV